MLILITGGASSGKSAAAETVCTRVASDRLFYIATMKLWDDECVRRAEKHRAARAGKGFETIECPEGLYECAAEHDGGCALLECMGNLLANEQFGGSGDDACDVIMRGVHLAAQRFDTLVIVTNEVFSDDLSYDEDTVRYIAALGSINRETAACADCVVEVCCGIPIVHKGREIFDALFY